MFSRSPATPEAGYRWLPVMFNPKTFDDRLPILGGILSLLCNNMMIQVSSDMGLQVRINTQYYNDNVSFSCRVAHIAFLMESFVLCPISHPVRRPMIDYQPVTINSMAACDPESLLCGDPEILFHRDQGVTKMPVLMMLVTCWE